MPSVRRAPALLAILAPLVVWSCTDAAPVGPEPDDSFAPFTPGGSSVVLQQVPGFFFLPPLSDGSPTIDGEFHPGLSPELRICDIGTDPTSGAGCLSDPVTVFAPGEATVDIDAEQYQWSWDTGVRPTANYFGGNATSRYYELQVAIGSFVLGSLILDPQKPNGPGQSDYPDLVYAFRVGETIPVKVFIGTDFLCDTSDPAVLECVTSQVVGGQGGLFFLDGSGITDPGLLSTASTPPLLSIRIQPSSIPASSGSTEFLLTLERLAVDVVDEGCGDSLDVLRIGDQCFKVTNSLEDDLDNPATISICLDPSAISFDDGTPLSEGQKHALEMVRWDSEEEVYEVIPGTEDDDCSEAVAASLAGMQSVALGGAMMNFGLDDDGADDGPSDEVGIRLGGLSSSFSNFSFLLRGGVLDVNGVDGSTIKALSPGEGNTGADPEIAVPLRVVNRVLIDGEVVEVPVPGATLRAETADGSVDVAELTTDSDGNTSVTWTVDDTEPGQKDLVISSFGVTIDDLPAPGLVELSRDTISVGVCSDGYGAATIDGVASGPEWACADSVTGIEVNLGGGATSAVLKTMNDAENAYFLLRVQQGTGAEIFGLRFDFDNTGDGTSADDDVVGYDAATDALFDGYLSEQCVNRSQSKCFASDGPGNQQVAAAAANSDGWTTYEISHPLNSGDGFDFDATTHSPIGYFFTLTNGGGAKGNTQYPAFRDYSDLSFSAVSAPGN